MDVDRIDCRLFLNRVFSGMVLDKIPNSRLQPRCIFSLVATSWTTRTFVHKTLISHASLPTAKQTCKQTKWSAHTSTKCRTIRNFTCSIYISFRWDKFSGVTKCYVVQCWRYREIDQIPTARMANVWIWDMRMDTQSTRCRWHKLLRMVRSRGQSHVAIGHDWLQLGQILGQRRS